MTSKQYEVPIIQTNYAKILVEVFSEHGFDVYKLLEDSGLPSDLFNSSSDFVPTESIKRLIYLSSSQLGITRFIDLLGLALREKIIPHVLHHFEPYSTIEDAFKDINAIIAKDTPSSSVHFETEQALSWVTLRVQYNLGSYAEWSEAFATCYIIELVRILTNDKYWTPDKIKLQSADTVLIDQLVPKTCQLFVMQPNTAIHIPIDVLKQPIKLKSKANEPKSSLIEWHTSFTDSVFELLRPYVKEHNLSIEDAARLLNFSVRTFQRKLTNEKTSFRRIKESLMFSVACEMMEQGHSITYISSQLGYTNISHFSRAFKRVSGITPKFYRQSVI